ncbi:MAG: histidinol dehydrogenase [Thermomicrobiales bacterium]
MAVAEIELDKVIASIPEPNRARFSASLPVEQDFAVIVEKSVPAADVEATLRGSCGPLASGFVLFDVFEGEQIGAGNKSLAYRVTFTAPDRPLTDSDVARMRPRIRKEPEAARRWKVALMSAPFNIRMIADLEEARAALTRRRGFEEPELSERMQAGIERVFGARLSANQVVDKILSDVRREGEPAVRRYTEAFDGKAPVELEVPFSEWAAAAESIEPDLLEALETSAARIRAFHEKQLRTSWIDFNEGGALGQLIPARTDRDLHQVVPRSTPRPS